MEETERTLPSVVSQNVLLQQGSWVSASHCQEGQGGKVYKIFKVASKQQNVGGKTRKARKEMKTRRASRIRKTMKTRRAMKTRKASRIRKTIKSN